MPSNITFAQLKKVMAARAGEPGMPSKSARANLNSALGRISRAVGINMDGKVGEILRGDLEASLELYRQQMLRVGLVPDTIKNKLSEMRRWAELVRTLDHEGAVREDVITPFQAALNELFATRKDLHRIAKQANVSWRTLRAWQRGAIPKLTSDDNVRRLARACDMSENALLRLLPVYAINRRPPAPATPPIVIESRVRQAALVAQPYLVRPDECPDELRSEWMRFVRHKVPSSGTIDETKAPGARMSVRERIAASKRRDPRDRDRVWRVRPINDYPSDHPDWVNAIGNLRAPSADKNFKEVCSFLGWLRLDPEKGGRGMPLERLSMGLLADAALCDEFLQWHADRVGTVNSGHTAFIADIRSILRPETGFLWLAADIGAKLGHDEAAWREQCASANRELGTMLGQYASIREVGRDPTLPIKPLLDMPKPLVGVRDALRTFAKEVRRNKREAATKARDLALLSLVFSNPLRLTNLRLLTYKPDNTGHIRQIAGGQWWVFVPKEEFKNIRGAAKDKDYWMPMSEMAAHYVQQYLESAWGYLGGPGQRSLVFFSAREPDAIWKSMAEQFATCAGHIFRDIGCPGFRSHAGRYLVGTSIVMATQGNVDLAAQALHDKKETVERHYKKLLDSYAARGIHAVIGRDMLINDETAGLITIPADEFTKPLPGVRPIAIPQPSWAQHDE
jgi:integrase